MRLPYDAGYAACPCFWGREPGSLVKQLHRLVPSFEGLRVLDAGCGEGKNSAFLAMNGALVRAIDCSSLALRNVGKEWRDLPGIAWELGDVRQVPLSSESYDIIVAYGLFHCFESEEEVRQTITRFQHATKAGGYNVVCTFNNRAQDLSAHPGFVPTLLSHQQYVEQYRRWVFEGCSDSDLREVHPHNGIEHTHSMTRILARKAQ